jgi:uncharacterized membrane protein
MKIKSIIIFSTLLSLILTNITVIFSIDLLFTRQIFTLLTTLFFPGFLLSKIIFQDEHERSNTLYSLGLSIFLLMLTGLTINVYLPSLGIEKPLSLLPILISHNLLVITLLAVYIFFSADNKTIQVRGSSLLKGTIAVLLHSAFPLLSILGAISINNRGTNSLTLIFIFLAALYFFFTTLFHKHLSRYINPIGLYFIALSLLLMLSLRSWFISGFDISMEYEVFRITQEKGIWAMENFKNTYNACLSITILPTYLHTLLNIPGEYIYKFVYPLIFAITPVGIYYLLKTVNIKNNLAFLASFFYMCSPWFIDPMVTLGRQEIAFIFFNLILLILFDEKISNYKRHILFIIFGVSLVVSHYSTTYITLLILGLTYFLLKLMNVTIFLRFKKLIPVNHNIRFIYIIFLFFSAFTWYAVINDASDNVSSFTSNSISNLKNIFNLNARNAIIDQLFKSGSTNISKETYTDYYKIKSGEYTNKNQLSLYSPDTYKDYTVNPVPEKTIPISNSALYRAANTIYRLTLPIIELLLVIGLLIILLKKNFLESTQYKVIAIASSLLLFSMIVLPYLSIGYNFDRLYMQTMFILAFIEIFGGLFAFKFILRSERKGMVILAFFYSIVFLYTYGFIWQLVGGKPVMWLNNFGYTYNATYTHNTEAVSANWLGKIPGNPLIYSTPIGRNILWAYAKKNNISNDLFPSTFDRNSYVFTTTANIKDKIATFHFRGLHLGYKYPYEFLDNNKDKIYNNGGSEIYK